MELAHLVSMIVRLAVALALVGMLKTCTLTLLNLAGDKTATGIMSYSAYTRMLTKPK